ncbi:MAG: hypothetical protein IJ228_14025 [Succinivibrio sp.]|nr:hypothetical protein [Succinivibrio sp.]
MDKQESVNLAEAVDTLNSIVRGEEHEKMQAQMKAQVQAQVQAKIDAMNLETARHLKHEGVACDLISRATGISESTVSAL